MHGPRHRDITLRDNANFAKVFGFFEPGGRGIDDLVITNGSPTATSVSANFTPDDNGKKLAVLDGVGITDGTTMTYVDAQTVTLSDNATATRAGVTAVVRALNCSNYTTIGAQVKYKRGSTATIVLPLTVDDSRNAVGLFPITAVQADIAASVKKNGFWDWLMLSPDGPVPWYEGSVILKSGVVYPS